MTRDLAGQVAMVTGGASGIGVALCRRLAARGASVVIADVDSTAAHAVATELGGLAIDLDVSSREAWDTALGAVIDEFGRLNLVALNAGTMSRPRGLAMDDDPLRWMMERYEAVRGVNIDGVAFGIMATIPYLEATGGGRIVATSSTLGLTPLPSDPTYSMTKHAVIGLVRSMAEPLAERGITIGVVCPGGVDTPMVSPSIRASGRSFATPDFVAAAIEEVLDKPSTETGGVWVSRLGDELWRYEFAPATQHPTTSIGRPPGAPSGRES